MASVSHNAVARAIVLMFITFMLTCTCIAMPSTTRVNDQNLEGARDLRHLHQAGDLRAEMGGRRAVAEIRVADNQAKILEGRFSNRKSEDRQMSRTGELKVKWFLLIPKICLQSGSFGVLIMLTCATSSISHMRF